MGRYDQETGEQRFIQPRVTGLRARFNWSTPIIISPHNSATLYAGGNYLFKSVDRGAHWEAISPDLTINDPEELKSRAGVTPEDTGAERYPADHIRQRVPSQARRCVGRERRRVASRLAG